MSQPQQHPYNPLEAVKSLLKKHWNTFPLVVHTQDASQFDIRAFYTSTTRNDATVLYAYGPGWRGQGGSFDVDCLKWQAFLCFNQVPFKTVYVHEPLMSPNGQLPFLSQDKQVLVPPFNGLKIKSKCGVDETEKERYITELSKARDASTEDADAFIALVETKIRTALLYHLWCEPENFNTAIVPTYGKGYVWPLNKAIMWQLRSDVISRLLMTKAALLRNEIYEEASQALDALTERLGNSEYFSGTTTPSSLDAVVFAYIHTTLTAPTPETEFRDLVTRYESLIKFSRNIWTKWFASQTMQ